MQQIFWLIASTATLTLLATWQPAQAAEASDFERDIAPLLVTHCLDCHQPSKKSGKLDLSTRAGLLAGGEQGPALDIAAPQKSLLLERVASKEMPPPEAKERVPLSAQEIDRLEKWLAAGATWPDGRELGIHEKPVKLDEARVFWSFLPVRRPQMRTPASTSQASNPLDSFVNQRLREKDLSLAHRAEPQIVLRRASLDVRGLPPSLDEQDAWTSDRSPDAYERQVDRLLADPAYGERWARHWLDLVRYADSNGYERDGAKPSVWRYRDYVIAALNSDKPYDRFAAEQLAGDELPGVNAETLIATGFHALGAWQDEVDPLEAAQYRSDELDDMLRTTAQTFLGLTLGCARCHNHKFDPLTMVDYYSFAAILAPLKRPNQGRTDRDLPLGTDEQIAAQKQRDAAIAKLQKEIAVAQKSKSAELDSQVAALRREIDDFRRATPDLPAAYRCFEDSSQPPETFLLLSGRASNRGPLMQPRVPAVLTFQQPVFPPPATASTLRRRTFAQWLTSTDNPLTARVLVNRVWQHHFGEGLVATPSDFGQMGARPTHPELLDWLAHWFMHDANWSLKKLHRLILTSETYRQASAWNDFAAQIDPENKLLWRFPHRRLDVEAIRDSMLAAAGNLNRQMSGPAVFFPIPAAAIEAHTDKEAAWHASPVPDIDRRTIYGFVKRTLLVPMLETLDFCDTTSSTDKRSITSIAPQALTLFNGEFVNRQAEELAQRLVREAGDDSQKQIALAFRLTLARQPTETETKSMLRFLTEKSTEPEPHASLVQLCRVILNLNEFVYPN